MQGNALVAGGLAGAGLLLLFDQGAGGRRRGCLRRLDRVLRRRAPGLPASGPGAIRRMAGLAGRLERLVRPGARSVEDAALRDRVRRRLGHVVSSACAIAVEADGGRVVLTGDVAGADRRAVISAVARVPGVEYVDDFLDDPVDEAAPYGRPADARTLNLPAAPVVVAALTAALAMYTALRAIR
jgi:hypothetical protein